MAQYLPLPDGSYLKLQEGESPEAGYRRAQQKYPEAFAPAKPAAQPESGFMPALRAGATELGGGISALMGKVGLKDIQKAQAEYEAAQKRAAEIFKPTEAGWTEAPITKFTELLGGSLPYMAAPLAAGAAAAALPITGPAALATGLGAAGLASATQFTATNLGRQMEEGKKLEQTDLGSAALAAVPQAALDTLSMRMIPGIGRLFGKAGIQVTKETAKEIAEQGLKRTLVDYSVNTGKTAGIEGLTEAAQQVFERLQAGLNITDPEARKEYFDSFVGGAVLGGTLSVPGRFYERGKAKSEARGLLEEEAQKQQAEQRKAEEEAKKDPQYLLDLDTNYQAAVARMKELQAAVPKRPEKGALPEEQMAYKEAVEARNTHLKEVLQPLAAEYVPRKAEIAQLKERRRVEGLTPLQYQMEQAGVDLTAPPEAQRVFTGEEEVPPPVTPEVAYAQRQMELAKRQDLGTYEIKDYADYLMQDPAMAKQLVENKTPIPGLSSQESKAVLGGLKLQLQEQEKQARAATRAELEQQQTDLAAQQRAVQTDAADLWKASIEATEEQATEELLRPNFELIQPTGPATVKTPENIRPIQSADTLLRRIDDLFTTRDQAARDTDTAFGSGNKEAGMKKAQEREAAQTALNQLEQTEGPGQALVTQRKAQEAALMNAAQLIDDLRAGRTLGGPEAGTASSTPETLINQINRGRDAFINAAVQEAAIRRRLFGKALPQEEATQAGDQMREVFNEWVTRTLAKPRSAVELIKSYERDPRLAQADWLSAAADAFVKERTKIALAEKMRGPRLESIERGAPEERAVTTELTPEEVRAVEQKALREFAAAVDKEQPRLPTYQIRGTKLITSDEGKARLVDPRPLEERRFGAYREATQVLQEQLQQIASRLREVPRAPQRVESLLKPQYAETEAKRVAEARGETAETRKGELVRRQEYVLDKIEKALMRLYGLEERAPADIRQTLERARAAIVEGAGREDITSEIGTAAPIAQIEQRKQQRAELQEKLDKEKNPFKRKALEKELAAFRLTYEFSKEGEPAFTAGLLDSAEALADQINTGRQTLPVAKLDPRQAAQVDSLQKQRAAMQRAADKETDAAQKKRLEDAIARVDARINLLAKPTPDRRIAYAAQPQAMAPEARAPEFDVEGLGRLAQQVNASVDAEMRRRGEEAGVGEGQLDLFAPETAQAERRAVEARTAQRVRPLDEKIARVQQQLEKLAEVKSYKSPREAALAIKRMDAFQKLLDAYTAQRQELVTAGARERYTTEVDERALRKEQERLRADVGFMRTTAARFANAPAVKQAREAVEKARAAMKRGQTLLGNIKAAWAEADKRKEAVKQGKIQKLEREVASQREDYRVAFMSALSKARLEQVAAKFQPDIDAAINQLALFGKERAKALELKDKEVARDIKIIMDMEREALQELRQQLAAAVRAPGAVLEPAEMKGAKQTRGFTQPEEVKAAADEWVQFERDALAKAEAKLAKLKGPEKAPAVREVAQQRKAVAQAENVSARAMTGLGLPGLRRVAGEVTPIKAEKEAAEERTAAEAERRAEEAEAVKARVEEKTAREAELEQRILDLGERRVEREEALKRVRTDAGRERVEKELAEINKQATLAQAQLEALGEKKPRRKGPATKISGAGLAKQRPLRTGYRKALEAAEEGMRREREDVVEIPGTFEFGPQEKLFSRGPTAMPSTTANVRTELKQAFPDLGRVQIYDSVDALIAANPQYEGKIPSDARGFVDTAGNKAFLIAENINQGQAMSVLLHEVGAHVGLRNLLGAGQYDALVNAVKSWEKKVDGSKESQVAQAARARVEAAETPAGQVNDELLAYTIEEAVNAGVKPTETKGVLGRWLSQVAALFRKALEKFGLPPKALDAQGIVDMAFGAAKMEMRGQAAPSGAAPEAGEILFSRNLPTASRVAENLVAEQPGIVQKLKSNLLGLGGRTQFIDKLAPVEEALKRGKVEDLKATQALYYLRMYDQRMHFTSQAITDGVPELVEKTRRDGRTERMIETKPGANIKQVVDILKKKDVVKAAGSADAANKLFTLYLAAIRGERVGYDTLNFGRAWAEGEIKRLESELRSAKLSSEARTNLQKKKASLEQRLTSMPTEADFKAAKAEIDANPVLANEFGKARDIYNQYNRNLIEFAVQTGAIDRALGNRLVATNDYIPYYRMREGVAELMIGKETPIRVGNLKDSPHLQELMGGDEAIFDFLTSSVQNTSMLLDMATKNLATKNLMFELRDVGLAKISKATKTAPAGAVTFKKDGEEYFAIVDTDTLGIDSELLVKGLAGIPTMFPTFVRLFGIPARFLRRVVVASPVYMARQIMRESTSAAIASGADIVPVLSSLKQIGKPSSLERRGITGGQVFTGMPEDQTRILKDMQAGKISLLSGLSWLEAQSAKVDALTREAQYQSYLKQGLSEMEASLMALESANFSKRGLSPALHMLSTLIPFLNAQIQGLDVLYKAFTGKMPMNERLAVRQKLWERGMLMFGLSTLYALSMDEEDEYYKNAKPEEKYGNWFVPIPGMKEPLRVPIPFELGYIFKALPEAMVNIVRDDKGAEEAWKAFKHIGMQTVPGLSSYFMPQAIKPALEVLLDRSFYTDRALESAREQMLEPGFRYRDNTTELAKWVGEATGFSPIKMEYLIRGYTGSMGMAALAMLSAPFGRTGPEPATKRVTDLPVIGTLFQPVDASGIIDMAYEKMNKVRQIQDTYKNLLEQGRTADANAYLKENADQMALASVAGSFRQQMGEITQYERAVRVSNLTPDQKREALDRARQAKIRLAETVRAMSDKTARQAAPA